MAWMTEGGRFTLKARRRIMRRHRYSDRCIRLGAANAVRRPVNPDALPGGYAWPGSYKVVSAARRAHAVAEVCSRYELDVIQRQILRDLPALSVIGALAARGQWDRVERQLVRFGVCTTRHIADALA